MSIHPKLGHLIVLVGTVFIFWSVAALPVKDPNIDSTADFQLNTGETFGELAYLPVEPNGNLHEVCSGAGSKVYRSRGVEPLQKFPTSKNDSSKFGFARVELPDRYFVFDTSTQFLSSYTGPVGYPFVVLCDAPPPSYAWVVVLSLLGLVAFLACTGVAARNWMEKRRVQMKKRKEEENLYPPLPSSLEGNLIDLDVEIHPGSKLPISKPIAIPPGRGGRRPRRMRRVRKHYDEDELFRF